MKRSVILVALAGLLGATYLVYAVGFDAVVDAALSVGWLGFALLWLYGAANFVLLGIAWLLLVPPYTWRDTVTFCWARAVRDSAGDALPFSQFGGIVLGARAMILRGFSQAVTFASLIVDVTIEMIAQIVVTILGIILLVLYLPGQASDAPMVQTTIIGIVIAILAAAAFVIVQRHGFSVFERIAERFLPSAAAHAAAVNRVVNQIHAAPWRMTGAFVLHVLGWLSSAFGTWLALKLIGSPISFAEAIAIESLLCAARSVAFFVPAAIGIQEAGYAVMMPLFGLSPEIGIAVSLLKRARELALAAPVLLSWQIAEGAHAVARKPAKPQAGDA